MSEFNPTISNQLDLEEWIVRKKGERKRAIDHKKDVEMKLTELQQQYQEVEFNSDDFKRIKKERSDLKQRAAEIEIKIRKINEEIRYKNNLKDEVAFRLKGNNKDDKLIQAMVRLKDKYADFTKDKTRVASMRVMAAEFRDELDKLIQVNTNN